MSFGNLGLKPAQKHLESPPPPTFRHFNNFFTPTKKCHPSSDTSWQSLFRNKHTSEHCSWLILAHNFKKQPHVITINRTCPPHRRHIWTEVDMTSNALLVYSSVYPPAFLTACLSSDQSRFSYPHEYFLTPGNIWLPFRSILLVINIFHEIIFLKCFPTKHGYFPCGSLHEKNVRFHENRTIPVVNVLLCSSLNAFEIIHQSRRPHKQVKL